jgi:biotin carboxyl carrier protein
VRMHFRSGERERQLEIALEGDACRATVDGESFRLDLLSSGGGEMELRLKGRRWCAFVAGNRDERFVFLNGRLFVFRLPDETEDPELADSLGGPNLVSQMPGTIVKLLVQPGQTVGEGAGLFIIESMKMETEVAAPVAGTVAAIHIAAGQTVGMGEPLIDIEPLAAD